MPIASLRQRVSGQRLRYHALIVWCTAMGGNSLAPEPVGLFMGPGRFPGPGSGQGRWLSHQPAWVRIARAVRLSEACHERTGQRNARAA
jgi:hypothetical protein